MLADFSACCSRQAATNAWDSYTQLLQEGIAEWKNEQKALNDPHFAVSHRRISGTLCPMKKEPSKSDTASILRYRPVFRGEGFEMYLSWFPVKGVAHGALSTTAVP